MPFGQSKADKRRLKAQADQEASGVTVVLPDDRVKQWHAADNDADGADFECMEPHSLDVRRSRMANMRMLLEGVALVPEPEDPFNGYFQRRDKAGRIGPGAPSEAQTKPLLTIHEVQGMLEELVEYRFEVVDEEALHIAGSIIETDDKPYEVDSSVPAASDRRHARDARILKEQLAADRQVGLRAPFVSDEIERKLLITVCLQTLTARLTESDDQKHITNRTTYIDTMTGRSPLLSQAEAREHPHLYMRYGHEDSGTDKAFRVLDHILRVDAEQHYEAIRYYAELSCVSGQLWRLSDAFTHAKGFDAAGKSKRDPEVREACQDVCEEIITSVISEWFMRQTMDNLLHNGGEGAAARWFLDKLKDVCHCIGERPSGLVIETVIEDVSSLLTAAAHQRGELGGLGEFMPPMQGTSATTTGLQTATAMLKTLVGTELPLVVDPNGVLQFTCFSRLYTVLTMQKRFHESWGTSDNMLAFYDEYAPLLAADFQAQKHLFASQVKDMTGEDVTNFEQDLKASNANELVYRVVPSDDGLPALARPGEDDGRENPYAVHMRQVHLDYLSARTRESAIFGKRAIERAIKERYHDRFEAWKLLAMAFFKLEEMDEAIASARHAIMLNPQDPQPHVMLAAFHWKKREYLVSKRESRLADLVEDATRVGRVVTLPDIEMAAETLELIDERRSVVAAAATEEAKATDGWSHKFFNAERRKAVDALVAPEVHAGVASLPPMTAELVKELARVQDDPGDDEYKDWMAHMSWANRYSAAISKPRSLKVSMEEWDRHVDQDLFQRQTLLPPEDFVPVQPKLY